MSFQNLTQANPYNLFCNSISNSSGLITSGEAIRFDSVINNSGGYAYFNNLFATGTVEITTLEAANANLGVLQADSILSLSTVTGYGDFDIGGDLAVAGNIFDTGTITGGNIISLGNLAVAGNINTILSIHAGGMISSSGSISANYFSSANGIDAATYIATGGTYAGGNDIASAGSITASGNINAVNGTITGGYINSLGDLAVGGNIFDTGYINIGAANNQIQLQPGSTGTQFNISLPTNPAGNVTASIYDPITPSAYLMLGVQPTLFYSNSTHPTLTVAQSGTTVFIISDAVYTITLPDISSGVIGTYFKFIFSTRTGANVISLNTVTANNGKFTCSIVNGGITASTAGAAQNTIRFETTAIPGDYVECISNGALWLCNAACATGGNITCP